MKKYCKIINNSHTLSCNFSGSCLKIPKEEVIIIRPIKDIKVK